MEKSLIFALASSIVIAGCASSPKVGKASKAMVDLPAQEETVIKSSTKQAQLRSKFFSIDNTNLFKMITIPSGSFQMGSDDGYDNEKPEHSVSISSFNLMEHEVTWDMYQPCIDEGVCSNNDSVGGDEGWGKDSRPVVNVSWDDTQKYITWLNGQTGERFRLPSEAEWEYAARAGTITKHSWGDKINRNDANYGRHVDKTSAVKSYEKNNFGLYDMHGNVLEWTLDCWNGSYSGAPSNGSAWKNGDCDERILRGGGWFNYGYILRSSYRFYNTTSSGFNDYGFRLAQDIAIIGAKPVI